MKNSPASKKENGHFSNKSLYHQNKPVIQGMGGGSSGNFDGLLFDDPALGMAFGLAAGGGYWYTLEKQATEGKLQ